MLLTDKYTDKIYGTLTCYDRMIIQGYIPSWSHAEGMTGYLYANNIRIFDFPSFFTIMKAANYRYLEFISSFDDHSDGNSSLTKVTSPVSENERSYRGINFFSECDLRILEIISRGEYMTFGMQGKDIRQHLEDISASAMSRIFKRLRLHGIIERII